MSKTLDEKLREICVIYFEIDEPIDVDNAIAQIKQVFAEEGWRDMNDIKVNAGRIIDGTPPMTGREWLSKFEKELDELIPYPQEQFKLAKLYDYWTLVEAAKRASGIE